MNDLRKAAEWRWRLWKTSLAKKKKTLAINALRQEHEWTGWLLRTTGFV
jgi:hypothetical protein